MKFIQSFIMMLLLSLPLTGAEYYVSVDGDDNNSGTLNSPFRTIQNAVNVMASGDVCYIREGRYFEEVQIKDKSNLTITAYPGEHPLLDGTKLIDKQWSLHSGSIYKTTLDEDIWQLFVDEKMMTSARWPNANWYDGTCWNNTEYWGYGNYGGYDGLIYDRPHHNVNLAAENKDFTGAIAILNVGNWKTWAKVVNNHSTGSNKFTYEPVGKGYRNEPGNHRYFLECKLNLLDIKEEWYFDPESKELYLWADNGQSPAGRNIRGKVSTFAINA